MAVHGRWSSWWKPITLAYSHSRLAFVPANTTRWSLIKTVPWSMAVGSSSPCS